MTSFVSVILNVLLQHNFMLTVYNDADTLKLLDVEKVVIIGLL